MKNPGVLLDAIVAQYRLVSGLVTEMNGDTSRIAAYYDSYPRAVSVNRAIADLAAPAILVIYDGTSPGTARNREVWKHNFRVILKIGERESTDTAETHYSPIDYLVDGVPTGSALKLLDLEFDSSCEPMDLPRFQRQSMIVSADGAQEDFWVMTFALTEKGDD